MKELFDINNFNVVSDEENYYFFRCLEPGDITDLDNGKIKSDSRYIRLRTDRERWEETHEEKPRWKEDSTVSLEEMYSHIKMHYSLQTNCISLSSNANVAITYGQEFSDKYVMIKVPKKEMGDRVFHAGQYILSEIERQIEQTIASQDIPESVKEDLTRIDSAKTSDEIKEIIKTRYTSEKPIDTTRAAMRRKQSYRSPVARISNTQVLTEEQRLEKNRIIAKLTVLEKKGIMQPLISRTTNNNSLIQTVGSAFSSSEQIYYGDIEGNRVVDISKEVLDMFSLLQQAESQDREVVSEIQRELIDFVSSGKQIEIPKGSSLKREDEVRENITIEEMYELTEGRVEYGIANSVVKNMFYLAKGQSNARELAGILREITGDNPKYEKVIEYIENEGFQINPKITTRRTNRGYRVSESVNLDLRSNEFDLAQQIKGLTDAEQVDILENGGLSNVREVMTTTFSRIQSEEKISREEYYAQAIIDSYDWSRIGIEEFTISQRNDLLKKLKEKDCVSIYQKLKEIGIQERDIASCIINIASKEHLEKIINSDNYTEQIQENIGELTQNPSIEQIETFLGYYDLEGTDIVLRDYQRNTVDKTNEIFEDRRFASVILPTGGGKSFVTIAEFLEHRDEPMLYLAPNNEILEQMKDNIIKYVHGMKGTIGRPKDEIIDEIFPNLKFETYPGLLSRRGKQIIKEKYGFIVLDELHRTGAKEWEGKLDKLLENQDEEVRVLGITATPRRDIDDRDMAREIALKLGYTEAEVEEGKHIAINIDLVTAIKLGLVVNPKIVTCEYTLENDGSMENLLERINSITDEKERKEKLEQYERLRRNIESAKGIPQILQENIKAGRKYIVFLPVTDQGEIEDEDGNKIGSKTGKDKIKEYEKYLQECLKDTGLDIKCYSMLGAYSDKKNAEQLQGFESDKSEETKFMLVMNKANEGLHIDGIDGIVWLRALDENSRILYLQQLGRTIYSEDPNNPTREEDRPIVIDLANNTLKVNIDKEMKRNTRRDDLELLTLVIDWVNQHGVLPDIESKSEQERRYAATLYRIQDKYMKYLNGFEQFSELEEDRIQQINNILTKGIEIDLWDIEFPPKSKEVIDKIMEVETFEIKGILKDYVALETQLEQRVNESVWMKTLSIAEILNKNGMNLKNIQLSIYENQKQRNLLLREIKQKGIDIERIIKENELDPDFPFGSRVTSIRAACKGRGTSRIEEEEKIKAKQLGLIPDEEKSIVAQTIKVAEILSSSGLDLQKIKVTRRENKKTVYNLLKDLSQPGIDIQKIIEDNNLDPEFPIGNNVMYTRMAYKGIINYEFKGNEKVKVKKLGLIPDERKSIVEQTIEVAEILSSSGVDLRKIKWTRQENKKTVYNLLKDLSQPGIDIKKIIEDNNLDPEFPIGRNIKSIREAYKGRRKNKMEKEEKLKAKQLGLIPDEEKSIVARTIEVAEILSSNGVDLQKITLTRKENKKSKDKLLREMEQDGIDIKKIIEDNNLDPEFPIGKNIAAVREAYSGTSTYAITDSEKKMAENIGLISQQQESIVSQTLTIVAILKEKGIDFHNVKLSKKNRFILLREMECDGIEIKQIIEDNNLDPEFPIGKNISSTRQAYRGNGGYAIKDEEKRQVEELGLVKRELSGKEIGQATCDATVEKCDEAQEVLANLLEKQKEGGIEQSE